MMRVEHLSDDVALFLADCRDLLPGLKGDVLLTDPVWPNCPPDLLPGGHDPFGLWGATMAALPPLRRVVAVLRCDSDPRFLSSVPDGLPFFRSIQLPYALPSYIGRVLGGDETAYWFGEPIRSAPKRRVVPGRAPIAQPRDRVANGHPCSRALVHFDWLVSWCSDDGETIIDPFMGSGTTGVAAVRNGRPFVGIEIDPTWFDLACRRIEHEMGRPRLALSPPPASSQTFLLQAAE